MFQCSAHRLVMDEKVAVWVCVQIGDETPRAPLAPLDFPDISLKTSVSFFKATVKERMKPGLGHVDADKLTVS